MPDPTRFIAPLRLRDLVLVAHPTDHTCNHWKIEVSLKLEVSFDFPLQLISSTTFYKILGWR